MNRGSGLDRHRIRAASDRFNEAPIHESGKWRPAKWGSKPERPASMRPRFMNRGSDDVRAEAHAGVAASMRPRFMNRGSVTVMSTSASMLMLQ